MSKRTNSYNSVLIVDDMASMRSIVRSVVKSAGITNILEAADGYQALEQLEFAQRQASFASYDRFEFSFVPRFRAVDLIILDCNMPKMNGIEFLAEIEKIPALRDIPVIMLTAENDEDKIRQIAEYGIVGYIVKPFRTSVLEDSIQSVFSELGA